MALPLAEPRLHVMMITEGTYPYHWGGVSTWCHLLLRDLAHIDFTLVSLVGDPGARKQFELPGNVVAFHPIPLWGIREVLEKRHPLGWGELWQRRHHTPAVVEQEFVPLFRTFLQNLYRYPGDAREVAHNIHAMYRFFQTHDFDTAMRSEATWRCFIEVVQAEFPYAAAQHGYRLARYTLADMTACMQWLYHWFFPIGETIPKTDIVHAAMVGVSTLIAVVAKLEHGAAYMLTEHGIYLRERYLAEAAGATSLFRKIFSLRFANLMTQLSYGLADRIAPCCDYNHRWELRHGARPQQLRTIYYGVDSVAFAPDPKPFGEPPVVVWVGRIDPLKDILTLLRAAALVHATRPDIEFRLFGGAGPGTEAYHARCLELHKELNLENVVKFAGFRANPVSAFNEGDIVILTSVSEAFPFVVLEAMLCEKPVVATAVGGVPEQVDGCGVAVEPRNPAALADAILKLMNDPELCQTLGQAARQKAIEHYSLRQSGRAHEDVYRALLETRGHCFPGDRATREAKDAAREYAFAGLSRPQPATVVHNTQLPVAPSVPVTSTTDQYAVNGSAPSLIATQVQTEQIAAPAQATVSHDSASLSIAHGQTTRNASTNGQYMPTDIGSHAENGHESNGNGHNGNGHNGNGHNGNGHSGNGHNGNGHNGNGHNGNGYNGNGQPESHHRENGHAAPETALAETGTRAPAIHLPATLDSLTAPELVNLAQEVRHQINAPVDDYEVTAMLESMGITDEVARLHYGTRDAFDLGRLLLRYLKAHDLVHVYPAPIAPPLSDSRLAQVRDFSRGLLGLMPPVLLLIALGLFGRWGNLAPTQVLVVGAGMTTSLLATSGFIQAISYRTATYLSLRKPRMAGRYLALATVAVTVGLMLVGILGVQWLATLPHLQSASLFVDNRGLFLSAYLGLTLIWMCAGGLSLIDQSHWLSIGLAAGLLVSGGLYLVGSQTYSSHGISLYPAIAGFLGFATALILIIVVAYRGYTTYPGGPATTSVYRFPATVYMVHESLPYFAYGALYMLLILIPHGLGWFGHLYSAQGRDWSLTSTEVGMTLSMPPLILAYGVAEYALRRFWQRAAREQVTTPGTSAQQFGNRLLDYCRRQRRLYIATLSLLSLAAWLVMRQAHEAGLLTAWLGANQLDDLHFIFNMSLLAYALLGIGLFNNMFAITLQHPGAAVSSVLIALGVLLAVGIQLAALHFTYAAVAFVLSAAFFALVSWIRAAQVIRKADFCFASVI